MVFFFFFFFLVIQDERKHIHIDCLEDADTNDNRTVNKEKKSSYIAPLLKTVVKGTALIGIFFLLHFRFVLKHLISSTYTTNNIHYNKLIDSTCIFTYLHTLKYVTSPLCGQMCSNALFLNPHTFKESEIG